jgi:hypothetical protein
VNHIYMAAGSDLSLGQLHWVKESGTNKAIKVIAGTSPVGIAEDMQWFYSGPYGGVPSWPIMVTYNNWGFGNHLFSYLFTQNMSSVGY